MLDKNSLKEAFSEVFSSGGDIRGYFAPGRVNLIGEHIDYNGGHVFPCAIESGTYVVARMRNDRKLCFFSENFKDTGIMELSLDSLYNDPKDSWANYPKGVFKTFMEDGYAIPNGFDIYVYGNIPGSGLSSSASLEVAVSNLIRDFFHLTIDDVMIARLSQEAEVRFCHMNCGIMDQFACSNGKKDKAIFLDCQSLRYEYVPLKLSSYRLVVTNSNKPHSLVSSHYNDRRKECEAALQDLRMKLDIENLCTLTPSQFEENKGLIKDPICQKRAGFAVYEEARTKKALQALKKDDILTFGKLINESGDGLRKEYEATCYEIDTLVELSRNQKGCIGSRETGGGWGGNIISLVKEDCLEEFIRNVEEGYFRSTGLRAQANILSVGNGGRRIF